MLIGIGHKSRSGKDTAADFLVSNYKFVKISFASALYQIVSNIQAVTLHEVKKDPTLMQMVADTMKKHYGNDVFINIIKNKVISMLNSNINVVVSDVRHTEEFDMIKSLNGTLIDINRSNRVIDRDPNHISEIQLDDAQWSYKIDNDKSLDDLFMSLNKIIEDIS